MSFHLNPAIKASRARTRPVMAEVVSLQLEEDQCLWQG